MQKLIWTLRDSELPLLVHPTMHSPQRAFTNIRKIVSGLSDQRGGRCWQKKIFPSGTIQTPFGKRDSWKRSDWRSQPITPIQQTMAAGSWDVAFLAEARHISNNLRREEEFATHRPMVGSPRRHQVHFQEDQLVPNRNTHVQVGMTPEEYNQ
jgi:hypothetical protein